MRRLYLCRLGMQTVKQPVCLLSIREATGPHVLLPIVQILCLMNARQRTRMAQDFVSFSLKLPHRTDCAPCSKTVHLAPASPYGYQQTLIIEGTGFPVHFNQHPIQHNIFVFSVVLTLLCIHDRLKVSPPKVPPFTPNNHNRKVHCALRLR